MLQIDSYPEATSAEAIDQAARFTATVGGVLIGLAVEIDIRTPKNTLAEYLIGLSRLDDDEEQRSRQSCKAALEIFSAKAREMGVFGAASVSLKDTSLHVLVGEPPSSGASGSTTALAITSLISAMA